MLNRGLSFEAYLKRLESLISTGMPGVYRVVSFFAVQHVFSLGELGHVASNMAIAQLAGYFSAIGWATLLLVRIPSATSRHAGIQEFYGLLWMSLTTTIAISVLFGVAWAIAPVPFAAGETIELLWGWTIYQVGRHYFVAQKQYRRVILADGMLTVGSCGAVFLGKYCGLTPSAALAVGLGGVGLVLIFLIGVPRKEYCIPAFEMKGLEFGLTNLVSGGITLIFAPLAAMLCGPTFAGVFSLLSSVSAIGALLPRAISLNQLPVLSKIKERQEEFRQEVEVMRRHISMANLAVLLVNAGISIGLVCYKVGGGPEREFLLVVALLLAVLSLVSASGVTHANVLMVFECSRTGLVINIKTSLIFAMLGAAVLWVGSEGAFVVLLLGASFVFLMKNMLLVRAANREMSRRGSSLAVAS